MNKVVEFVVNYSQSLNSNAQLNISLEQLNSQGLDTASLLEMYQNMLLARTFDTKAIALQRTGRIGTYASCLGQEAISTAIGKCMQAKDVFVPGYRDAATFIQRGAKMEELLLYWGGDERGMDFSFNNQDLPYNVPISSQCIHAVGLAYAFKLRQQERVAVVVCGDGGTSEGDFYEAINAAGTWDLPIVFVVVNNQWAISVPRTTQSRCETLAQKAIAGGFDGQQLDGNDIIGCHLELTKAIKKARSGQGPSLIEAVTYRLSDHTTADDASRYRADKELQEAWLKEPIARLKTFLLEQRLITDQQLLDIQSQCDTAVNESVDIYLASEKQSNASIFKYMYKDMPKGLQQQLNQLDATDQLPD
jgi:pyruvate dehydrogenase E1 component alpha subunit